MCRAQRSQTNYSIRGSGACFSLTRRHPSCASCLIAASLTFCGLWVGFACTFACVCVAQYEGVIRRGMGERTSGGLKKRERRDVNGLRNGAVRGLINSSLWREFGGGGRVTLTRSLARFARGIKRALPRAQVYTSFIIE